MRVGGANLDACFCTAFRDRRAEPLVGQPVHLWWHRHRADRDDDRVIGAEFATLFNNAMMPGLAPPEKIGRLSGTGWAMGYLSALIGLGLMLAFLMPTNRAATPALTFAGLDPLVLFGLDPKQFRRRADDRAAHRAVVPCLHHSDDAADADMPKGKPIMAAIRGGVSGLLANLKSLPRTPDLFRFLLANMLYQDALGAVFAFGGIFGAAMFGWTATEAGVFGIVIILSGIFGAVFGGRLDDRLGAKAVIIGSILLMLAALLGILSIGESSILFGLAASGVAPGDGLLAAGTERFYLVCGVIIGLVAGPMQAASRSLLVRLSPPDAVGRNFGLFTLAGKATAFLGPTLVALAIALGGGHAWAFAHCAAVRGRPRPARECDRQASVTAVPEAETISMDSPLPTAP